MKLVAMMLMQNDENRFLRQVLEHVTSYADEIVILDDGSDDNSVEIAKSYPNTIVHQNETPHWWTHGENKLREQLYNLAIERNPDWVLYIASDEVFEKRFEREVRSMLDADYNWYQFLLCHMWDEAHFISPIVDHKTIKFLFRFDKDKPRTFANMIMHCGGVPAYLFNDPPANGLKTDIRIKHLGFIGKENRLRRIERNERLANMPGHECWASLVEEYKEWEKNPPRLEPWKE